MIQNFLLEMNLPTEFQTNNTNSSSYNNNNNVLNSWGNGIED
jgi:hypothetical protein